MLWRPILKHRRGRAVPAISRELVETIQFSSEWTTVWDFSGCQDRGFGESLVKAVRARADVLEITPPKPRS
jgi:hypothetical protein